MKHKFILSAVCLIAIGWLTSCEEDEDVSITGTWRGEKYEVKASPKGIPVVLFQETNEDFDDSLEFNSDGTVAVHIDGAETAGTWEWIDRNKKLTATVDFNNEYINLTETYTVEKLSANELVLAIKKEQDVEDPDSGAQVTAVVTVTMYFTRTL